ncbi:MAG: YceI family protein [Bacteroidota bacterium]
MKVCQLPPLPIIMNHQVKWSLDTAHSQISFSVRHLMISEVRGLFRIFDASIYTTGKDFSTVQIELWIEAASIFSGEAERDEKLRGADFFDVQHHPQINFISNTIVQAGGNGDHQLWGDLTIKGITKNIPMNVKFGGIQNFQGNQVAGFTVSGSINRSDWNMNWNTAINTGGVMVGEEIFIACNIELIKTDPSAMTMELALSAFEKASL